MNLIDTIESLITASTTITVLNDCTQNIVDLYFILEKYNINTIEDLEKKLLLKDEEF